LTAIFTIGVQQEDGSIPGVSVPLSDQYTLTAAEQGNILSHAAQYNAAITAAVSANDNLHLMDIQPMMADLFGLSPQIAAAIGMGNAGVQGADGVLGYMSGGINLVPLSLTQAELYNSVFSTDFVHPNPRGQALIANEIIKVLNAKYGATIPTVDPLAFEPIYAPF
jgi:lysophospholipase L1-like esterase